MSTQPPTMDWCCSMLMWIVSSTVLVLDKAGDKEVSLHIINLSKIKASKNYIWKDNSLLISWGWVHCWDGQQQHSEQRVPHFPCYPGDHQQCCCDAQYRQGHRQFHLVWVALHCPVCRYVLFRGYFVEAKTIFKLLVSTSEKWCMHYWVIGQNIVKSKLGQKVKDLRWHCSLKHLYSYMLIVQILYIS